MWTILKHWLIFAYRRIVSETPPAKHHKFLFGPPRSTNRKIQQPAAAAGFFVFKAPCHGTKTPLYLEKQFTQEDTA